MNKTAIKNFAIWARVSLIESAKQRAFEYEITKEGPNSVSVDVIAGRVLSKEEKDQRSQLINEINAKGFDQVMEEAAYTWFNRFIALRYMEVNGYLPSKVRVFSNEDGEFKPAILDEAMTVEINGLDRERVLELLDKQDNETLYKVLLIAQCNLLNTGLPYVFEKISNWTELLFPNNLLKADSIIGKMVSSISEEDWKDAVQIIGWLYQYYNTEPKAEAFATSEKMTKDQIPAVTQLFTPEWIVRYLVENSIGCIGAHRFVQGEDTCEKWKYYLGNECQTEKSSIWITQLERSHKDIPLEQIRIIDPCMGSGHMLVYAFDVLAEIYQNAGWSLRDAAISILENNLYGLDIDDRAYQMAYLAVMMKARQYNRHILNGEYKCHIHSVKESNLVNKNHLKYFGNLMEKSKRENAYAQIVKLLNIFRDAKEYGSLLSVPNFDWELLEEFISNYGIENQISLETYDIGETQEKIYELIAIAKALSQKYDVVITNPPYMGINNMGSCLYEKVIDDYEAYKHDMCCVFIERCRQMTKPNGYVAMITQQAFMFNSRYNAARDSFINHFTCKSLLHLGPGAFEEISGEVVQACAFIFVNGNCDEYVGRFIDLQEGDFAEKQRKYEMVAIDISNKRKNDFVYKGSLSQFRLIDGLNFSYWISPKVSRHLMSKYLVSSIAEPRHGLVTGSGELFMRFWSEVAIDRIMLEASSDEKMRVDKKWFPYTKGGPVRRWYGNREYIVNWENDGFEIQHFTDDKGKIKSSNYNLEYNFRENITWSDIKSGKFAARFTPAGGLFDTSGPALFLNEVQNKYYLLALMNSKVMQKFVDVYCIGLHYSSGAIGKVPLIINDEKRTEIEEYSRECVEVAKAEWDSFELSWEYKGHPFVSGENRRTTIKEAFQEWKDLCDRRISILRKNEEEINRIFADVYGLDDEIVATVEERDISLRSADIKKDIRNFLSYVIGCIFGRYSPERDGIIFAGGNFDIGEYNKFLPDEDNIIPICDDDYFDDDVVCKVEQFLEYVYGKESLEDNLKFIAEALGGKGSPREVIRNYFISEFFKDHCNTYSLSSSGKRPIYWLFDSGKKNGFKCLIYMHRYQPDTIARIRTDYIHELQARYRTAIEDIERNMDSADAKERVKMNKQLSKLQDQELELRAYEEKIHHLADQMIEIDLDDGVKANYAKFQDVLAPIK